MDDLAIGRTLRALRLRLRWRQRDLAGRAGVSQQLVSRIERGRLKGMSLDTIRRVFAALDADAMVTVRWRGGQLDRLLDERHAEITGRMAALLQRQGWQVLTEVTFSDYGERGSIDRLAWHPATRTLLVVGVKTEITSAEEMLRRHDAKARLAPAIARDRFGQAPAAVARLLVVGEGPTNRRRIGRLEDVVGGAYPMRGRWCVPGCGRRPTRWAASCSSRAGPGPTVAVQGVYVGPRLPAGYPRSADPARLSALRVVSSVARRTGADPRSGTHGTSR